MTRKMLIRSVELVCMWEEGREREMGRLVKKNEAEICILFLKEEWLEGKVESKGRPEYFNLG